MKSLILGFILLLNCTASANPVVQNQTHAIGPYNISFDLIGVRDLNSHQHIPEKFEAKLSSGINFNLVLEDNNTGESLQVQILEYDNPVAKDAVNDIANPYDSYGMVDSIYGTWFVSSGSMLSGFKSGQAIDDHVACFVFSDMSWHAIERILETLRIQRVGR